MKVVLTGSSGRVGRAIFASLSPNHQVIGIDARAFSTTHIIGDCTDPELLKRALEGADGVVHTAGPHAPHVGTTPDGEFERVNVEGTQTLYEIAKASGVRRFVYTSTTALYGHAIAKDACSWVTEETEPQPRSIYHTTKLAAECALQQSACPALSVAVLRMSRCFPEPAPEMLAYRVHRGIDARDVGSVHALALEHEGAAFERFVISGETPFQPEDCPALSRNAPAIIRRRIPALAAAFDARGWAMPARIDRVYCPAKAQRELDWQPRWGWREVLAQADRDDLEVLPAGSSIARKSE